MRAQVGGGRVTRSQSTRNISTVLAKVGEARRRAEKDASDARKGGHYFSRLSAIVDARIKTESGQEQLIWIACAAELGLLKTSHLKLTAEARAALSEKALNALFWAVVGRWSKAQVSRLKAAGKSMPAQRSLPPCQDCCALDGDRRRYAPHRWLEQENIAVTNHLGSATQFRCLRCETRWMRRLAGSEHFVGWSTCSGRRVALGA